MGSENAIEKAPLREAVFTPRLEQVERGKSTRLSGSDDGMSTAEYAVGTIAAVAFAVVLYGVVTGSPVVSGLANLVQRALTVKL